MKEILKKIDSKSEVDRIFLLHWSHTFLVFVLLLAELSAGYAVSTTLFALKAIALIVVYKAFYKTITHFFYTYWAFSAFIIIYLVRGVLVHSASTGDSTLSLLYMAALLALLLECYVISSPLFFPRVRWWEYDFRYKSELKIQVEYGDLLCDGRLTDLRRDAGCVVTFKNFEIGEIISVKVHLNGQDLELAAKIFTSKEYTAGRGITYGVKFNFHDGQSKEMFDLLSQTWRDNKKARLRNRFTGEERG